MGQTLQGIVDYAAPVVLTATGHPELAAVYSGTKSYAETGDPLSAIASAGMQYAGNEFFGKAGQLGAPSATDPLVSGINAGTQLATDVGEQAGIATLENSTMLLTGLFDDTTNSISLVVIITYQS
jgi:spore germination protein GerM